MSPVMQRIMFVLVCILGLLLSAAALTVVWLILVP